MVGNKEKFSVENKESFLIDLISRENYIIITRTEEFREVKMKEKNINVSIIQPIIIEDNSANFIHIEQLIKEAAQDNPDIICLPERWYYIDTNKPSLSKMIQNERGLQYQMAKRWSKKYQVPIIAGAIWEKREGFDRPFITSYFFNRSGEEVGRQDKIQLYKAENAFFESGKCLNIFRCYLQGNSSETSVTSNSSNPSNSFDLSDSSSERSSESFKFSILICFDLHLRTEIARKSVENGAEIIFSPTAIIDSGEEHWITYIKARALENRVPIVSVNSIMNYGEKIFKGRSKIIFFEKGPITPVKFKLIECDENACVLSERIELNFPKFLRKKRLRQLTEIEGIDIKKN